MRDMNILIGVAGAAGAALLGVWVFFTVVAIPTTETVVAIATTESKCSETPVTSYAVSESTTYTPDIGMTVATTIRASGDAFASTIVYQGDDVKATAETVYDGKGLLYLRAEGKEWEKVERDDSLSTFPSSAASMCPDTTDATFLGDDTIDGVDVKHYSLPEDAKRVWDFWVNADGWLVQAKYDWVLSDGKTIHRLVTASEINEPQDIVVPE